MPIPMDAQWLQKALQAQVQHELQTELIRIADDACERLRAAIMARADRLALQILDEYVLATNGREITIRVKKVVE